MLARSLGQQVPIKWIVKDFKMRGKIPSDVESFSLVKDHLLFCFKTEEKRDKILHGGLWAVIGQLLAVKTWMSDFVSGSIIVKKTTIWLRHPELPIEFRST